MPRAEIRGLPGPISPALEGSKQMSDLGWRSWHWLSCQSSLAGHVGGCQDSFLRQIGGPPYSLSQLYPLPSPGPVWPQLGGIRVHRPVAAKSFT